METIDFSSCPDELTVEHIAQYQRDGYLAFTDVLTPEEVARARAALTELVGQTVRQTQDQHGAVRRLPGSRCFVQFEPGYAPEEEAADIEAVERKVRKLMNFCDRHADLGGLASDHARLQAVTTGLLGPNPILFQDMALIKPPFIGSEKPWHQDDAYFAVTPLAAVCGVWIALDDAGISNGCMHVVPGGHRMGPLRHHHTFDCEIVPGRVEAARTVPVPLPTGGAMWFQGLLPHQTPPNTSPLRRRALQFHYRSADSQILSNDEYAHIFAEADGTPASCAAAAASR